MVVGDRLHEPEPENVPPLVSERSDTLPVGVVWPAPVSVTVALHVSGSPTATVRGEQLTLVVVSSGATVSGATNT